MIEKEGGILTALYIILGIIAFFVILLSIKFVVTVHYEDDVTLSVSWLFLKFGILPPKENKKPKKEKKKKEKPKEESEVIPEPKEKKDNMFVRFYHNQGLSGVIQLIKDAARAVGGMFKRIGRAFLFEELYISMLVGAGDAAATAEKYGKVCSAVFPSLGLFVSTMRVKKYNLDINPDFINGNNKARFHAKISVRPIALINAVIIVAFQLLFKVLIKLLKHSKVKKTDVEKQNNIK